jgi:hypothetical protein|tara:strand:- start:4107 stop:4319 length:213 start_codon:yes stop_codon:yes gene_type:complete
MADFVKKALGCEPEEITKLLEERCTGYASEETTAKEIAELTGLDLDVAKAFSRGWSRMTAAQVRGYKKKK